MKNYLKYSLWLTLIVLFALIGMHWLPAITIDGHTMRRVDLLSDVRMPEPDKDEVVADSLRRSGCETCICRYVPQRDDVYRRL